MTINNREETRRRLRLFQGAIQQRLCVSFDSGQRGAEFMRDVRDKVGANRFKPFDLCEIVEHENVTVDGRAFTMDWHRASRKLAMHFTLTFDLTGHWSISRASIC